MKLYAVILKKGKFHGEMIVYKINPNEGLAIAQTYAEAVQIKRDIIKDHGHKNFYVKKYTSKE